MLNSSAKDLGPSSGDKVLHPNPLMVQEMPVFLNGLAGCCYLERDYEGVD